jgi:hypothetical protein
MCIVIASHYLTESIELNVVNRKLNYRFFVKLLASCLMCSSRVLPLSSVYFWVG